MAEREQSITHRLRTLGTSDDGSAIQTFRLLAILSIGCVCGSAQYSSNRPGAVDPHQSPSQRMLLRDDELLAGSPVAVSTTTNSYSLYNFDQTLTNLTSALPGTMASSSQNSLAVAGRFLSEANDQLAYLYAVPGSAPQYLGSLTLELLQATPGSGVPGSITPAFPALTFPIYAGPKGYGDAVAIAKGDLDGQVDKNGMRHDEIVVAYRNMNLAYPVAPSTDAYRITLEVIDCSAWDGRAAPAPGITTGTQQEIAEITPVPTGKNSTTLLGSQNYMGLSLATGDFDGDGKDEIALSYVNNNATTVSLYRYATDSSGNHTLTLLSTNTLAPVTDAYTFLLPDISTAAGDFNGKGNKDQLAIARVSAYVAAYGTTFQQPRLVTVSFNADYSVVVGQEQVLGNQSDPEGAVVPNGAGLNNTKVELLSGLFNFSPTPGVAPTDFNYRRCELALVFNVASNNTAPGIFIHPFSGFQGVLSNLLSSTPAYLQLSDLGSTNDFSAVAGGFAGLLRGHANAPQLSVAISSWYQPTDSSTSTFALDLAKFGENCGLCEASSNSAIITSVNGPVTVGTFPLATYDYTGNSVYLGSPVQITTQGVPTTDFVIQEPPKHLYYNETSQSVVNVSRYDAFNSQLVDTTNSTLSVNKQNTYSYGTGVSGAISASATIGGGLDVGIAGATASVTTALNASVNYDSNTTAQTLSTQYGTYNYSITGIANHDDYIALTTQDFDIWRYRVYGGGASAVSTSSTGGTLNNYLDFVVPGPYQTDYVFGLNYDEYEPIQENGNLLSYPLPNVGGTYIPADMGSFCIPSTDPSCSNPIFGSITAPASFQYGGGSTSFDLTFGSTTTQGQTVTSSNNLKESADIKVTVKAKADFLGNQGGVEASVDAGQNSSYAWTNASTATTTFGQTTELKGNAIPGNSAQSYTYYPVMYSANDGTMKVAYGAKINDPNNPAYLDFWNPLYGRTPDPALNLPWRFLATYTSPTSLTWVPETTLLRKKIRGFQLHRATKNSVTGAYDYLAGNPTAGTTVRVEVQVHNYSLSSTPVNHLDVQFELAMLDTTNGITELDFGTCPNGSMVLLPNHRCKFKNVFVSRLGPQATQTVYANLDTTGLGGVAPGSTQAYLVFVVLDPEMAINETYPLEAPGTTDYGQNNEGWGQISVLSRKFGASTLNSSASLTSMTDTSAGKPPAVRDLSMGADSLSAVDTATGSLRFDEAQVSAGQPLLMRIGSHTDQATGENSRVLIYDGNPKSAGKLIAVKNIPGGDPGKPSYAWFNWIAMEPGRHILYAKVIEDWSDSHPGNNIAQLTVNVTPFRKASLSSPSSMNKNR